jgi:hypothetical protein
MRKNTSTVVVLLALTSAAFIVAAACASSGGGGGEASAADELGPSMVVQQNGGRVLMCPDLGESRLFMCMPGWDLERCGFDLLGNIQAKPTGVGAGSELLKEMLEQLHREAMRLKADAVFNLQEGVGMGLAGMAVRLKDPNCRAGG